MKYSTILAAMVLLVFAANDGARAQTAALSTVGQPWSERTARAACARWPAGRFVSTSTKPVWNYELGMLLEGMDAVWLNTADTRYFNCIKSSVDQLVEADGSIPSYKSEENRLVDILLGRQLMLLYGVTQDARYARAAALLYKQLQHQPRTASGGLWIMQKYPNQMWLDGIYMAEPFYAEYALTFHHPEAFADIVHQFALMDEHMRDAKFSARAMAWRMMALVDTLDYLPEDAASRKILLDQLERDAAAVTRYQDAKSGLWFQVLDKSNANGNYLESSASCMFVYALFKSVRRGYLPERYLGYAERGYKRIIEHFIKTGPGDEVTLTQTVKDAGLGGDPYRDSSYAYYVNEKIENNDPTGIGAFLLAAVEMENAANAKVGRDKTVLMDAWFNSQKRADAFGEQVSFHYKWYDESVSGYSLFGHIFENLGARTSTLFEAPTEAGLNKAQVYIIVSPDIPVKNPKPNYMTMEDADQIAQWVKAGGVLMLMENDPANADIEHFNLLADKFGIHFNSVLRNHVEDDKYEAGRLDVKGGGPIFHEKHTIFMKDICTITAKAPAVAQFSDRDDVLMATAKYGKGTVYATVDPWLYNEYTDGHKLPAEYDNFAAGKELARWILEQTRRYDSKP